jgi:hypothetical protein
VPRDMRKEWEDSPAGKFHKKVTVVKHKEKMDRQAEERDHRRGLVIAGLDSAQAAKAVEAELGKGETVEHPHGSFKTSEQVADEKEKHNEEVANKAAEKFAAAEQKGKDKAARRGKGVDPDHSFGQYPTNDEEALRLQEVNKYPPDRDDIEEEHDAEIQVQAAELKATAKK